MNYYERHIGDYLKDTAHLSLLEHGIYGRLLDLYYTREGPIPEAQVMRLVGARTDEERSTVRDVLNEFFVLDGGFHRHSRCDREIARYQDKAQKAAASANARWSKPATQSEGNATAMRPQCEGNAPSNQTPVTKEISKPTASHPPAGGLAAGFAEFWQAWPKGERKQDKAKCAEHWKRNSLHLKARAILDDVRVKRGTQKWAEGFIEAPLVYLRGKRWEDGVEPEAPPAAVVTVPSKAAEATAKALADMAAHAEKTTTPVAEAARKAAMARFKQQAAA